MTYGTARAFAEDWIESFNRHDLGRIMSHYAPDVTLISPIYLRFTKGRSDTVHGIAPLRDYFSAALNLYPDLRFTLLDIAAGTRTLAIRYHTNLDNRMAIEVFTGPPAGPATYVLCHYSDDVEP